MVRLSLRRWERRKWGYFGSKATAGLCQPLIAMMPPHATYIETHLGGGAIMRRKAPALRNIGIERDAQALDEFECDYPVERIHGCAHRFLAEYAFEGSELIYSDPPYLKRTRTSRRRYRFDYEEADHIELLERLKGVPCQVMVSGYPEVVAKPTRRQFTAEYRLRILEEADRCTRPGEVGRLLRREGLYTSHLAAWRKARRSGSLQRLTPNKRGAKPAEHNPLGAPCC